MNAFNTVNLSAACIITSREYASNIGIPESQWIYPLAGAGANEHDNCEVKRHLFLKNLLTVILVWERSTFVQSPAICETLDQCLASSNLRAEDIDMFDFYS